MAHTPKATRKLRKEIRRAGGRPLRLSSKTTWTDLVRAGNLGKVVDLSQRVYFDPMRCIDYPAFDPFEVEGQIGFMKPIIVVDPKADLGSTLYEGVNSDDTDNRP